MLILGKSKNLQRRVTGRLSDGSDRQEIVITDFIVKVEHEDKTFILTFDHDPTEQEIQAALASGLAEEVTTFEDMARKLADTRARLKAAEEDNINVMLALVEVYETMLGV